MKLNNLQHYPAFFTYSIVARDVTNGDLGLAVASKFLAVGSVVLWAEANVGAIATQSYANTTYGPNGLKMLGNGFAVNKVINELTKEDENRNLRQVGVIDANGNASSYTGNECHPWAGHLIGENYACQGNILTGPETLDTISRKFEETKGELSDRLIVALQAGDEIGGDRRGKQSAALLVVRYKGGYGGFDDKYIDLRVDDHIEPVQELARLLKLHHLYLGSSKLEDKITINETLTLEIQKIIKELGIYKSEINGRFDEETSQAIREFIGLENLEERIDLSKRTIDPPALEYIRNKYKK